MKRHFLSLLAAALLVVPTEDGTIIRKMNEGEIMMMDGTTTTVKGGPKSKQGGMK